jgi:hypothetical protein
MYKGRPAMRIIIGVVLALSLMLSVVPAIADDTFQAFSQISAEDRARLTPLGDDQLASIEGARHRTTFKNAPINIGINVAVTPQLNICALCRDVTQVNAAAISQTNRF